MKTLSWLFPGRRIGTTSYIFPFGETPQQSYEKNLELLGPHVEFVQLLLLGREYTDMWDDALWVESVVALKEAYNLGIVVHLPLDLHLWPKLDEKHLNVLERLLWNLAPLQPFAYVLHLDTSDGMAQPYFPCSQEKRFFHRLLKRLEYLGKYPLVFENTQYDLTFFRDEILCSPFGVCFDIGHWWLLGRDEREFLESFGERVKLFHLHGVRGAEDHLSLAVMEEKRLERVLSLVGETPTVIEVFSLQELLSSLVMWKNVEKRREIWRRFCL
ncbi:MAG: hypothetical protein N2314_06735 [Brevinematales bacterium]|nr:hypothetical protein [Brevinematales bacterium]